MTASEKRALLPFLRDLANEIVPFPAPEAAKLLERFERRPSETKATAKREKQIRKSVARAAHGKETAEIRTAVELRAGGRCECGCGRATDKGIYPFAPEMDHFYGRSRGQSVETCWMLTRYCHSRKTRNEPSAAAWDDLWAIHCTKYGYPARRRREAPPEKQRQIT